MAMRGGGGLRVMAEIHRYRSLKGHGIAQSLAWAGRSRSRSRSRSRGSYSCSCSCSSSGLIISLNVLEERLCSEEWALADQETRRLLIVLAGEGAVKRNYVFFSEVQFIPASSLAAMDQLWRKHSNNRFGYSVQRRIWNKANRDFTEFFKRVGWMKRLEGKGEGDAQPEHYSYRSFPGEFQWDLSDSTPEGHLPLTNALRGTQLLATILQHPAFLHQDQDQDQDLLRYTQV